MEDKKITISVDARPLESPLTGIGYYTHYLLKEMIKFTPSWVWNLYSTKPFLSGLDGYENVNIRTGWESRRYTSSIYSQVLFPLWANKDKADIFWSPRHHLPLFLVGRIKKCVTVHDLVWHRHPETMSALGRYLDRLLMPKSVHMADLVVSVSNSTKAELNDILRPKKQQAIVSPAPKPLMKSFIWNETKASESYFLFVGTNEPRKNLARLIEAFNLALKSGISIRKLVVVGMKGWGRDELAYSIQRFNLHSNVDVKDYLSESELIDLYRGAHALVMPSLYEGFGMPLVEAMSCGIPVITSNCSSMPEVAGNAALYVDPFDVGSIADAMILMSDDVVKHKELSQNAVVKVKEYSWEKSAQKMIALIEECVSCN
ncbi:glycosyltransferase family 4 protein [Sessilibacter corallicola]|uniref:Glycosyltransferase family 1 protein n=1 Tax=Sessilibacter corallicola TaxID=2904075 RepID=A0ABQ0A838_9GAMM